MIEGRSIRKQFHDTLVLNNVNIAIQQGQLTVLFGPSGGGKSTLIRALALIEPPDSGSVTVDGKEYRFPWESGRTLRPPWPQISVVFQQLFLWPHLTLRGNIELVLRNGIRRPNRRILDGLVERMGMANFLDRYPNQVSLGQRQRAALARAIVLEPSYILLDEVTSFLDLENAQIIMELLMGLKRGGTGILLVTHAIGIARRVADRVCFFEDGTVVAAGKPEMLTAPTNPRLRRFLSVLEASV